jgi:hypothetical protein
MTWCHDSEGHDVTAVEFAAMLADAGFGAPTVIPLIPTP